MSEISDQRIHDLLRRNFNGAVPDDGFSAQVTRALPARQRPRPWLLPAAALAGSLLAWVTLLPSPLLQQVAHEWLTGGFGAASAGICVLLLGLSLLSCGWALEES
ncbi:hypothetical protein ACJQWM_02050 [Lysobacter sp. D1-1-M9]